MYYPSQFIKGKRVVAITLFGMGLKRPYSIKHSAEIIVSKLKKRRIAAVTAENTINLLSSSIRDITKTISKPSNFPIHKEKIWNRKVHDSAIWQKN